MFPDAVYTNATLLVPGGTVKKYRATEAWKYFSNIVPTSIGVTMTATEGGSIRMGDEVVSGGTKLLQVKPNSVLTFEITPEDTHFLDSVTVNGENVTAQVVDGRLTPSDLSEDLEIIATFTAKPYFDVSATASEGGTAVVGNASVMWGNGTTVTLTTNEGHELISVTVNGVDKTSEVVDGVLTLSDIREAKVVVATFQKFRYTVTAAECENGTIQLSATEVEWGDDVVATLGGVAHYEVATVSVNGEDFTEQLEGNQLVIKDVRQDITISATFRLQTFTVSENHTAGGSVQLSGNTAQWGSKVTVSIMPDSEHFLQSVTVNGTDVTADVVDGQYTLTVEENTVVSVTFVAKPYYSVTATATAGGTVSVGSASVMWGNGTTVTLTANEGYELKSVTVNDVDKTSEVVDGVLTLSDIRDNIVIVATFQKLRFAVTTTAGEGGSVMLSTEQAEWGDDVTVTITPNEDYELATLTVNGTDVTSEVINQQYVIRDVRGNVEVAAIFRSTVAFVTIGPEGMATYCSDHGLDFSGVEGITAYIACGVVTEAEAVVMVPVDYMPASKGMVVKGEPGTYKVPFAQTKAYYMNMLKGKVEAATVAPTDGDNTNYFLKDKEFLRVDETGTMGANSAILQLPTDIDSEGGRLTLLFIERGTGEQGDKFDVNSDGAVDVADIASIISEMAARARMQKAIEE